MATACNFIPSSNGTEVLSVQRIHGPVGWQVESSSQAPFGMSVWVGWLVGSNRQVKDDDST